MSASNSNVTVADIPLTPQRVTFNGVDLGGTTDSVTVGVKYDLADVMVDQFGKTILTSKVSGQHYSVKLTLAEAISKDKWKIAFPHAKEVTSGGNKMVYFDMQIGDDLLAHAAALILHPLSLVDADLSEDIKMFKAACISASEVKYGPEKQTGLAVEFRIFPDTSVSPAKFMIYGDPTIGLVAASASNALAGSNTGNGTISSIVAYSAGTKSEIITVACVGQTSGNNFNVSGSISGALGPIHIAAANLSTANFTSPEISLTLNQGTVQFANGDSFTIQTVASNYA